MKTYTYDAAGNPLSDGATTFTWNVAGKLSTTVNNGKTHAYRYNALDQRVSKNGPLGSKFTFFYDEAGQLIGEYRDNSTTATPTDDWVGQTGNHLAGRYSGGRDPKTPRNRADSDLLHSCRSSQYPQSDC